MIDFEVTDKKIYTTKSDKLATCRRERKKPLAKRQSEVPIALLWESLMAP